MSVHAHRDDATEQALSPRKANSRPYGKGVVGEPQWRFDEIELDRTITARPDA